MNVENLETYFGCLKETPTDAAIQKSLSYRRITTEINNHIDECSEITITFKQRYRDILNDDEIHNLISSYMKWAYDFLNLNYILLIQEYGDNNNLHYHGLIRGKAKYLSQLKGLLNRRFGRNTIRCIRNTLRYTDYLLKEQSKDTLNKVIIYDI